MSSSGPPYSSNPYTIAITATATGSVYNVTSDCLRLSYARTLADPFTPLRADEGLFEFHNDVGSFSPGAHPALRVGNLISLTYTNVLNSGESIAAYNGRIKSIMINPQLGYRTTVIEALTDIDRLSRTYVDTPLLAGMPVSSLWTEVMTRTTVASWQSDLITDTVDFASFDNQNVVDVINQIIRSGYYSVNVDGAGTVSLRSRYFERFGAALGVASEMAGLTHSVNDQSLINKMTARALQYKQITDLSTISYINKPIVLPASGSTGFVVDFFDPRNLEPTLAGSIAPLVSGTDYYVAANSDGSGTNHTSAVSLNMEIFGGSAIASLYNSTGADVWLTTFQLRGYPLQRAAPLSVRYESASSQAVYGLHEASFDNMLISDHEFMKDIVQSIVGDRGEARDSLVMQLVNEQPLIWTVDVGDILSVQDIFGGSFNSWSIRAMRHEITLNRGEEHRVTFHLREPAESIWLILDDDPRGKLDTDRVLAP